MHKCYHQLAYHERCRIKVLLSRGFSMRGIAGDLNRSPATISREVARNRGGRGYRHGQAQEKAVARRSEASGVPRKLTEALWRRITGLLRQGWSPEQVEGRLKRLGEETVGREWICRQVRADRKAGGDLCLCLRRRGRKPNWKGGRHAGRGRIPGRVDIAERPAAVEEKSRVGDWELDTIVGAMHRGALLSSVDRGSWFTILELLAGKAAAPVTEALLRCLGPFRDPVPFLGARPERARQRPGAPVLPEGRRLPPGRGGAGARGRGPAEPPPPQGAGLPHALRGLPRGTGPARTLPPGRSRAAPAKGGRCTRTPGIGPCDAARHCLQCRKVGIVTASGPNEHSAPLIAPCLSMKA